MQSSSFTELCCVRLNVAIVWETIMLRKSRCGVSRNVVQEHVKSTMSRSNIHSRKSQIAYPNQEGIFLQIMRYTLDESCIPSTTQHAMHFSDVTWRRFLSDWRVTQNCIWLMDLIVHFRTEDLTCKRGSVGQSEGLLIPAISSVRFRLKPENSNSHGFSYVDPQSRGTKLFL